MKISLKRNLPSIANIEAFLSVARLGSITGAAEELFLTQGAVSKQVLDLEKFLGMSLFTRTAQGLQPTAAGQALFKRLSPLVSDLVDVFTDLRAGSRSVLNVSVPPTLGMELITPNLSEFLDADPSLVVNVFARLGDVDLDREGLDAAIIAGMTRSTTYESEKLFTPAMYPYAAPALLRGAPPGSDVLQHCKLIGLVTMPTAWPVYFEQLGMAYSPGMVGTNHSLLSTAAQAVLSGQGIGLLPEYLAAQHVGAGTMVRVADVPYEGSSPYYLICRPQVAESDAFRRFRAWLLALLASIGYRQEAD